MDLNPDDYPFIFSVDRCDGSCNTVEDPFGRICAPNEIEEYVEECEKYYAWNPSICACD